MDWTEEVYQKIKRKNEILFSKDSIFLQDLILLIQQQNHRTLALWAFDLADETIKKLQIRHPGEERPAMALQAARLWAFGKIKMPVAQRKILDCHAAAKEMGSMEDAALCHAIGQACSVVHTRGHAIGFPIYDLTSLIYRYGIEDGKAYAEKRKQEYWDKMMLWHARQDEYNGMWTDFMLK